MRPGVPQRTYAIPFDAVWNAAVALMDGGLRRWCVDQANDLDGTLAGMSVTLFFRAEDDVSVQVGLDRNGQTTVAIRIWSRKKGRELARNRRAIRRFLDRLDRSLAATPDKVLSGQPSEPVTP